MKIIQLKIEYEKVLNLFEDEEFKIILNQKEMKYLKIYQYLSYLLAKIYIRSDWGTIAKSQKIRSEDVFQHKIKAAGNRPNLNIVIDKLCNSLGLQSIDIITNVIDELTINEKKTLQILRRESIYISRKAIELANILVKYYKELKKI